MKNRFQVEIASRRIQSCFSDVLSGYQDTIGRYNRQIYRSILIENNNGFLTNSETIFFNFVKVWLLYTRKNIFIFFNSSKWINT